MAKDDGRLRVAVAELAARCPQPLSLWRHRTGGTYRVLGGAVVEATLTPAVVYVLHEHPEPVVWVRPLAEFLGGRFTPAAEELDGRFTPAEEPAAPLTDELEGGCD